MRGCQQGAEPVLLTAHPLRAAASQPQRGKVNGELFNCQNAHDKPAEPLKNKKLFSPSLN